MPLNHLTIAWRQLRKHRTITAINRKGSEVEKRCRLLGVADDFFEQYHIGLVAGRGFARESGADPLHILLNETAAAVFGFALPRGRRRAGTAGRRAAPARDRRGARLPPGSVAVFVQPYGFYPVDNAVQNYSLQGRRWQSR